ncbi:hypothetical protein MRA01_01410 [Methylobacterium radiotolerans]|nr:hypothetical protein MRA01_01410 [Methylobacterium radiotolerans]
MTVMLRRPGIVAHDDVGVEFRLEGVVELVRVIGQPEDQHATDGVHRPAKRAQIRQVRHEASDRDHDIRARRADCRVREFQRRLRDPLSTEKFGKALGEIAPDPGISIERIGEGARDQHVRPGQRDRANEIHPY